MPLLNFSFSYGATGRFQYCAKDEDSRNERGTLILQVSTKYNGLSLVVSSVNPSGYHHEITDVKIAILERSINSAYP